MTRLSNLVILVTLKKGNHSSDKGPNKSFIQKRERDSVRKQRYSVRP